MMLVFLSGVDAADPDDSACTENWFRRDKNVELSFPPLVFLQNLVSFYCRLSDYTEKRKKQMLLLIRLQEKVKKEGERDIEIKIEQDRTKGEKCARSISLRRLFGIREANPFVFALVNLFLLSVNVGSRVS